LLAKQAGDTPRLALASIQGAGLRR